MINYLFEYELSLVFGKLILNFLSEFELHWGQGYPIYIMSYGNFYWSTLSLD